MYGTPAERVVRSVLHCLWLVLVACGARSAVRSTASMPSSLECSPEPYTYALASGGRLSVDRDGHRLWRGDCAHAAGARMIVSSPTARFVDGAVTPDGTALVYSDRGAIWSVDL